jgi:ElaB/YqjD/DUF883 family membrane-anchored ribosome-binding protein
MGLAETAESLMSEAASMSDGKIDMDVLRQDLKDALDKKREDTKGREEEGMDNNKKIFLAVQEMVRTMEFYINQIKALKDNEKNMDKKDKYSSIIDKSSLNQEKFATWVYITYVLPMRQPSINSSQKI